MAAKYRKVDPRLWTDERFATLDRDGKVLALWLMTSTRVNRCGIVQWSPGLASEETGIPYQRIDTVCHTVCDTLKWVRDTVSRTIFLRRWWRYNQPDNEKALLGALSDLHDLPANGLRLALATASADLKGSLRDVYDRVLDTVYDTVSNTVSPQEQEQEQESEKPPAPKRGDCLIPSGSDLDTADFHASWQQWLDHYRGKTGHYPTPQNQLHALQELERLGLAKALKDVAFSIRKDAKTILDSSNDFQAPRQQRQKPAGPSGFQAPLPGEFAQL